MRREIGRKHIELFPNKHTLLEDDLVRVKGIVMHALAGKQKLVIALCSIEMTCIRQHHF